MNGKEIIENLITFGDQMERNSGKLGAWGRLDLIVNDELGIGK
jgi:hypothetical protein